MSNLLPRPVVAKCADASGAFVEEIIKIADEYGIDRNELIHTAFTSCYGMRHYNYSEYTIETEEKRELVNG